MGTEETGKMGTNDFKVDDFIKAVDVKNDTSCEYEVTKMAMESYTKYPCYQKDEDNKDEDNMVWSCFAYENSVNQWLRDKNEANPTLKNEYAGAFLLGGFEDCKGEEKTWKNATYALTADIITSIKTRVNDYLRKTNNPPFNGKGWSLKKYLQYGLNADFYKLKLYFKAFAIVYFWYGNMMPVSYNAQNSENWNCKLKVIQKCFEDQYKYPELWKTEGLNPKSKESKYYTKRWQKWIDDKWKKKKKTFEDFIKQNFFQDVVKVNGEGKPLKLKPLKWNVKDESVVKNWFLNNTKIIIQRSYRIYWERKDGASERIDYQIQGSPFTDTGKKEIQEIFKHVFKEAGFYDDNATEDIKEATNHDNFLETF